MRLSDELAQISKSFKNYASRLEKLEIRKVEDLFYHLPSRYEDFSLEALISSLQPGEVVTITGTVTKLPNPYTNFARKIQNVEITDETGSIEAVWFNQPFLLKTLHKDDKISISGQIKSFKGKLVIQPTEYELIYEKGERLHTGGLIPIYPETRGVSSKWLRRQIHNALHKTEEVENILPEKTLKKYGFTSRKESLLKVHFPKSVKEAQEARAMLSFEEVFLLNLRMFERKKSWEGQKVGVKIDIENYESEVEKFIAGLPFELTAGQKVAWKEIKENLGQRKPMNRLLQGDVGSGKTIVAATAIFLVFKNGLQSVFMAPTEILAEQHYQTLKKFLTPYGIRIGLVTGSTKENKKEEDFDVLVGTHALLEKNVAFKRLGLIVIDEQQRFGVTQRGILREKGEGVHVLTMTATPIPRTVALTLYGDLDISLLSEIPKERLKIKTWLVPPEKRVGAYSWIEKEIRKNKSQAFVICPFIEESESMQTIKAATTEFETLRKNIFPKLKLALLHGKLKPREKEKILTDFRAKKYDILVATPVVEVGIDIPNATVIVIEAAERFGLSQLHQLRGRVGRGEKQSYCLLFTDSKNPQTLGKLKELEKIHLGTEIAELDYKLRGPGEIYGKLQSGQKTLKIASFSDFKLLEEAKKEAQSIFSEIEKHKPLQNILRKDHETILPD